MLADHRPNSLTSHGPIHMQPRAALPPSQVQSSAVKSSQVTLAYVALAALAVVTVGIVVQRLTCTRLTPSALSAESEFAIKKPQRKSSRTGAFQARSTDVERRIVKLGANRRRAGPSSPRRPNARARSGLPWHARARCAMGLPSSVVTCGRLLPTRAPFHGLTQLGSLEEQPSRPSAERHARVGPPPLGAREIPHCSTVVLT